MNEDSNRIEREFDLEDRVTELERAVQKMLPGRRAVLQSAGAIGLLGFGASGASAETEIASSASETAPPGERANSVEGDLNPRSLNANSLNKVWAASTVDEINDAFDEIPETGGYVSLDAGEYGDDDWTEQLFIPEFDGGTVTIDLTGCVVTLDSWEPGSETPLIRSTRMQNETSQSINIVGGWIDARGVPADALGTGAELWDTSRCNLLWNTRISGEFDIGVDIRQENGCGHHTWMNARIDHADVGLRLGEREDSCTKDRSHFCAQISRIGEIGALVNHARQNDLWIHIENSRIQDGETTGIMIPNGNNGSNRVHLIHGVRNDDFGIPIHCRNPYTKIDVVGTGHNRNVDRSIIHVPARMISMDRLRTSSFHAQYDLRNVLVEDTSGSGEVRMGDWLFNELSVGGAAGDYAALESPSRGLIPSRGGLIHVTLASLPEDNGIVRYGLWDDANNYLVLEADPVVHENWRVLGVDGGTTTIESDTGVAIEDTRVDLHMYNQQFEEYAGPMRQHWSVTYDDHTVTEGADIVGSTPVIRLELESIGSEASVEVEEWGSGYRQGLEN